jgi:predicted NBD/HSP70 family sugar kinase
MKISSLHSSSVLNSSKLQKNAVQNQRQGVAVVNLGGTSVTYATQNGSNNIIELKRANTPKGTSQEVASKLVQELVAPYIVYFRNMSPKEFEKERAFVLAMPGLIADGVAQTSGFVGLPPNFKIKEAIQAEFEKHGVKGLSIGIVNDAVAPANADYAQFKNSIFVINGTGTGGTVSKLISGEFGHYCLDGPGGATVENTVSGKALAKKVQELAKAKRLNTFLGIKVDDLYKDEPGSQHYDKTLRHIFANHTPFQNAATYLKKDDQLVQSSVSTKERAVLQELDDHLHHEMGRLLATLRSVNPTADGIVLNGSITDYLNLEKLRKAINANIGEAMKDAFGIKNTDFFIKVEAGKALEGATNIARDLLKNGTATTEAKAATNGFPWWQTCIALGLGAGLGFLGKSLMDRSKPTPSVNTEKITSNKYSSTKS